MKPAPVSKIAEVATCQRRVYLRAKYGERSTPEQDQARRRGEAVHERAFREKPQGDKRCFVATAVYGEDDPRTMALRTFRDDVLVKWTGGRALVKVYYAVSPIVARAADRSPPLRRVLRNLLDMAVGRLK